MKYIAIIALALAVFPSAAQSSANMLAKAQTCIADVKARFAPDSRQAIYDIKAYNDNNGNLTVGGEVSDSTAASATRRALAEAGIDYADGIKQLPYDKWAQVRISAASMRTAGRHSAEMATQAVLGTPLRVLTKGSDWWRVQTPDRIFACPLTVTGSIGIFGMLPNGKGLLEKLGVNPQFVTTNQLSDIRIPLAPITDSQMAALQAEINRGYDKFINRVALGRHMPESKVRAIAEGRVWDGKKALELGLVDQLGTLEDAIAWVATTSKVDKDYDVVLYPKTESSFMDMVMSMTKTGLAPQMDQMLGKIEANPFLLAKGISIIQQKPLQARAPKALFLL